MYEFFFFWRHTNSINTCQVQEWLVKKPQSYKYGSGKSQILSDSSVVWGKNSPSLPLPPGTLSSSADVFSLWKGLLTRVMW